MPISSARPCAALLALLLCAGCRAPVVALPSGDAGPFPLGVASGDPYPDRAMLWTRYDGAKPLRVDVWEGDAEVPLPDFGDTPVTVEPGGFVHLPIRGLKPGTFYRYAFSEQGVGAQVASSRQGRFRTGLGAGALERLSIGAVSCTSNALPLEILKTASHEPLDAFLLLGDTIYADPSRTLPEFEAKWTQNLGTEGYRALRSSLGTIATWDDHEFQNDWAGETIDPGVRANGARAFFEHTPLFRSADAPDRIWRSIRWGATVEFFVLDCRGERKPSTRLTPQAEYISKAQLEWLKQALADSPSAFKVILNSVPIGAFPDLFQLQLQDRWEGYAAQRAEVLRYIEDQKVRGVIWLSGDFHMASTGRVSLEGPGKGALEVLAGPGAQFSNPVVKQLHPPQFDFVSPFNNFAVLDLDPFSGEARVSFHDEEGDVFFQRTYVP